MKPLFSGGPSDPSVLAAQQYPGPPTNGASRLNSMPGHPISQPVSHIQRPSSTPPNKRIALISAVLCTIVIVGIGAYFYVKLSNTAAEVTLYRVSNQNVTQYIGGGGIVYPNQQVDISYSTVERVVSVLVKAGDHVTANQALLQLDPTQLNAQITEASNEVASAQAFLNSVSATGNSVTIAQAQQAYNLAKGKYDSLVAQLSSFTLHDGKLVAPFAGVVTAVNVNPSEIFAPNKSLLTLMDEFTVLVHAKVPLMSLGQVHVGQKATVTPSALPNLNMTGTVSSIIPQADPQTDTYEVWVSIPNPNDTLLPGMSAFVRIQENGTASVVPRLAVLNTDRESAVFVVRHDHAYLQQVHLTGRSDDAMYIDTGVVPGDQVVLVGLATLQNGQQVHVHAVEDTIS